MRLTSTADRPESLSGDRPPRRARPAGVARKRLLLAGISLGLVGIPLVLMTVGASTTSALGLPMINTVTLGSGPYRATTQSHNHRIAVTPDGIFLAYLSNWDAKTSTGLSVVARSTDEGLTWTKLLTVKVTNHKPASLEADSAGNVYAFQPGVAGAPKDAYMYILPKSQDFANNGTNYLDLPGGGWGKFTSAYDASTNQMYYANLGQFYTISLLSTSASDDTYTERELFSMGQCKVFVAYPQIYVDRSGSGLILYSVTVSTTAAPDKYYEDRFMVSTDHGQTWQGTDGTITSFPIHLGCSDDPTWLINPPSQVKGDSDFLWLDNAYVQDGKFLFMYTDGDQFEYRRFDWATKTFDTTVPAGTCLSSGSFCQDGLGGFFAGNGTTGSRIYFTAPNLETHDLYTIYSDDDGATWHDLAMTAVPLGGRPYATSGTPTLDTDGDVVGAVTAVSKHGTGDDSGDVDSVVFFRANTG